MNINSLDAVLRTRVSDGCMLLDTMVPNWFTKVNVDELEISNCTECVIGQLFGHFNKENLSKVGLTWKNAFKWGFCFDIDNFHSANIIMDKLTIIWKEVISERQKRINKDLIEDLIELSADMELIEV